MGTLNVGRVRPVPKGEWSINTTYTYFDLVTYSGSSFLYISSVNSSGILPTADSSKWMLIAEKGDQGIQGVTGVYASTIYEFPNVGNDYSIYVATDENATYRWNESTLSYICIGRDYTKIDTINGGSSTL